jgi:hypothetical protein
MALSESDWAALIADGLRQEVEVRFTSARKTVLHVEHPRRRGEPELRVRMQRFFAESPPEVRAAVVTWLRSGRRAPRAMRVLDRWIEERLAELWRDAPRGTRLVTRGRAHDLASLAQGLVARELAQDFGGRALPGLTWGRAAPSRSRHSLRLGSYDYLSRIVRVHTVLDQEAVPAWFVRYVLFHELLHAALPSELGDDGRHVHHGALFRQREAAYPDAARAYAWEREHLPLLIRSARTGRPLELVTRNKAAHQVRPRGAGWVQRVLFGG